MKKLKNDTFLRACFQKKVARTPIWIMRQAGRYLPEYRAVRAKHDFLTMCKTPELAAEVTIQPVDLIGVDAAILFSDILVIPEAMGMELIMEESKGPVFPRPVRSKEDAGALRIIDPQKDLKYVLDAIHVTKEGLDNRVPLIGFSGAPWTLLTYMVEGKGSKNFSVIKQMIYSQPALAHELLQKLTDAVSLYLAAKIEAGCDAVQIFDTWAGNLSPRDFAEFSLPYITQIVQRVKKKNVPVIVFPKGANASLKKIAKCGADVVGVDWLTDMKEVRKLIGGRVAIQGNLDPTVLYGTPEKIRQEALNVLEGFGSREGHIFNLGHGILPDISPANAKLLVDTVHAESKRFHSSRKEK